MFKSIIKKIGNWSLACAEQSRSIIGHWPLNKRGFTFIEVMLTISLFILLASVGTGAYFKYYTFSLINYDVNESMTIIKQARFRALKNPDNSDYGVHLDPVCKCLIVFKETYSAGNPGNITLELQRLNITDLNLDPNIGITNDIIFEKQTGKTQNFGNFTIGNDIYSYTFNINSQGVVD